MNGSISSSSISSSLSSAGENDENDSLSFIAEALSQPRLSRHAIVLLRAMRETGTLTSGWDMQTSPTTRADNGRDSRLDARRALFRRKRPVPISNEAKTEAPPVRIPTKAKTEAPALRSQQLPVPSTVKANKNKSLVVKESDEWQQLIMAVLKRHKSSMQKIGEPPVKRIKVAAADAGSKRQSWVGAQCA